MPAAALGEVVSDAVEDQTDPGRRGGQEADDRHAGIAEELRVVAEQLRAVNAKSPGPLLGLGSCR